MKFTAPTKWQNRECCQIRGYLPAPCGNSAESWDRHARLDGAPRRRQAEAALSKNAVTLPLPPSPPKDARQHADVRSRCHSCCMSASASPCLKRVCLFVGVCETRAEVCVSCLGLSTSFALQLLSLKMTGASLMHPLSVLCCNFSVSEIT